LNIQRFTYHTVVLCLVKLSPTCYVLSSVGLKLPIFLPFGLVWFLRAGYIRCGATGVIRGVIWVVFTRWSKVGTCKSPTSESSIPGEWKFNQFRFIESIPSDVMSCICHECKIMFFSQEGLEVHNQQKHKKIEEKDNRILDSFAW